MGPGHLKAELDRLAGAIERAGGRVTERDLNYVEDSAELFYERDSERYEIYPKRLPDPLPGVRRGPLPRQGRRRRRAELDHLRTLTAVIDTSAQRAESAIGRHTGPQIGFAQ
jgi:hypothetical protein